jgi:hypothetical protein
MMRKQTEGAISIGFAGITRGTQAGREAVGYGTLDLGLVSYGVGAKSPHTRVRRLADRLIVTTEFGLTIADNSLHAASAMLLAATAYPENVYTVSVDGVRLQSTPQMVQPNVPLGRTSLHRLQIEIPNTVTEKDSQFHNNIVFQVIPN